MTDKNLSKRVYILQHVASEGAGTLADFMKSRDIPFETIALYEGQKLPEALESVRAVLIMGGPMNVYEEDRHPFLKEENVFLKKIIEKDIPCLGVCLGSQLIAKALGAKVYKAAQKEAGWGEVMLSEDARHDALFSKMNFPVTQVLQWHEDTFDIPTGAIHLASSRAVPNQAYRYKKNLYALQFHIEVDEDILKDWFKASPDLSSILKEYAAYRASLQTLTAQFYTEFFRLKA